MQKKPSKKKDEIELAKSIFDEIVEETESEDWNKEKRQNKSRQPESKKAAQNRKPNNQPSN